MTIRIYTDRSRIETSFRCPRRRWLEYHEAGTGIQPRKKNMHLAVGGAVHAGLESLLVYGSKDWDLGETEFQQMARQREHNAVAAALADFSQFSGQLEGDQAESASAPVPNQGFIGNVAGAPSGGARVSRVRDDDFQRQLQEEARALGMNPADFTGIPEAERRSKADRYLFEELSALVEALVRAYARRRLRPLLEEFEVLEVEREGEWKLGEWVDTRQHEVFSSPDMPSEDAIPGDVVDGWLRLADNMNPKWRRFWPARPSELDVYELWFMSRPDALLRHRQTNELQLLSYKTTGSWDIRKARDVQHDMQGLSEGVEVERRLAEWWQQLQDLRGSDAKLGYGWTADWAYQNNVPYKYAEWLAAQLAPPRVAAIRYEFLIKGERREDKDLSAQLGIEGLKTQKSHLIRQYIAVSTPERGTSAYRIGDVCWSWDFIRPEDQQVSKLYPKNWKSRAVWEQGSGAIRDWIDALDRTEMLMSGEDATVGMAPRTLGYKSDAQAMGVTVEHPLDAVFVPPVTVYRQEDQLLDWVEQTASRERETAERIAVVQSAGDAGQKRSLLNQWFQQNRGACEYPTQCPFAREQVGVCWGGEAMQAAPLENSGGEYVRRVPNHPQEAWDTK